MEFPYIEAEVSQRWRVEFLAAFRSVIRRYNRLDAALAMAKV
jgi:hypothetical protein